MTLTDILFGNWTPPNVPGRLISNDDALVAKHVRREHRAYGQRAAKRAYETARENAERIKVYVMKNPWCTAQEVGSALGLTKSPVYNHLNRFKNEEKIEIGRRKAGAYTIICYRWVETQ